MAEEEIKSQSNHLTAKELLQTRGIRAHAYEEYARSSLVLPKIGEKLFEPNSSWLQEKQINRNLENTKDLIKIERVNRLSQLAVAEWLSNEKRALVTKRSGIEWINYGIELGRNLYLIPEEALLLLELNCLELLWNGLSLSIQQAYELLLDSSQSDVTLMEYRVFSHLAKLGYRIQRFHPEKLLTERTDDSIYQKKKVIVVPDNGQWMEKISHDGKTLKIDEEVKETVETIINDLDTDKDLKINGNSMTKNNLDEREKNKGTRLEIVSEETVIEPIKIVRTLGANESFNNKTPKWTAARIQRNVKQLPRRNDNKRKNMQASPETKDIPNSPILKRIKHEVIDLSDDDIQEIPREPSRMEILNYFPNIANNEAIKISKHYIPPNINPQKTIYQCDKRHLEYVNEFDQKFRSLEKSKKKFIPRDSLNYDNRDNRNYPGPSHYRQNSYHNGQYSPFSYSNGFIQNSQYLLGGRCIQHRMIENVVMNQNNTNLMTNRWSTYQVNVFKNSLTLGYSMGAAIVQNTMNICNNILWQTQNFFRGRRHDPRGYRRSNRLNSLRSVNDSSLYQPSFTKVPASSWFELKRKWRESKTITIDDEEDKMDCSEVEVVEENIQPLIGPKHCGSLGEVFEKLRIIKSAQEKIVRKKKGDYKISYKVYSNNSAHFRKSNPGTPMFHIIITSHRKSFLQPVELNRLQQDGNCPSVVFAVVSECSIIYLQTGVVLMPNLANEYLSN